MIAKAVDKIRHFLLVQLWQLDLSKMNKRRAFVLRQVRIFFIAGKGFIDNRIQEKASALTYYTLLSIVPVIAMIFAIAKGFGFRERLRETVMENATHNREVWLQAVEFAENMLDNTQGGIIAGVGIVILLWSVMRLMIGIEEAFNEVWQIKEGRSWSRKVADYLTLMLIAPILFLLSSSTAIFLRSQFEALADRFELIGIIGPLVNFGFQMSPYILIWLTFTLLYAIMPNTRVNWKSALIAAVIAGTTFQLFQFAYINLQIGVSKYNAIYGSFAALPLFLIWLQISWLIVLMGAELAFANQNVEQYEHESEMGEISMEFTKKLTVLVMQQIIQRFLHNEKPLTDNEISNDLNIPVRIIRQIVFKLKTAGFVAETPTDDDRIQAYLPKRDIHDLRLTDLNSAIENQGLDRFPVAKEKIFESIHVHFEKLEKKMAQAKDNVLIKDLNKDLSTPEAEKTKTT